MSKRSERLFEALGQLPDEKLDEALETTKVPRRHTGRWLALAACLMLVVGTAALFRAGFGMGSSPGGGHSEEGPYLFYAGPVLPLTAAEEDGAISAERTVTWDFLPLVSEDYIPAPADPRLTGAARLALEHHGGDWYPGKDVPYSSRSGMRSALVTDAYALTNSGPEERTVTVRYPFTGNLRELYHQKPTLILDGEELGTELHIGPIFRDYGISELDRWQTYETLLTGGTYREAAFAALPDLSGIPAIVYAFTDPYGPERTEAVPNPSVRADFRLDYDETWVLSSGFNGGRYDREGGRMVQEFSVPRAQERGPEARLLVVLGEDIRELTVGGYVTGGVDDDTPRLPDCGASVERYEADLEEVLRYLIHERRALWESDGDREPLTIDEETEYGLLCRMLTGVLAEPSVDLWSNSFGELMEQVEHTDRVFYLEARVALPAGATRQLSAVSRKDGSYDYARHRGRDRETCGYDLMTTLDSNLNFTGQTAQIEDRGAVELVRQDFGFDLKQGIRSVPLDPARPHYGLEVREKK